MNDYIKVFDCSLITGLMFGLEYQSDEGFFSIICDLGFIRMMYIKMTPEAAIELGFVD